MYILVTSSQLLYIEKKKRERESLYIPFDPHTLNYERSPLLFPLHNPLSNFKCKRDEQAPHAVFNFACCMSLVVLTTC